MDDALLGKLQENVREIDRKLWEFLRCVVCLMVAPCAMTTCDNDHLTCTLCAGKVGHFFRKIKKIFAFFSERKNGMRRMQNDDKLPTKVEMGRRICEFCNVALLE